MSEMPRTEPPDTTIIIETDMGFADNYIRADPETGATYEMSCNRIRYCYCDCDRCSCIIDFR